MWSVLMYVFNVNYYIYLNILHNLFKGSITSKGDLAMEYFGYNGILCRLEWMCGLFQDN